MKATLLPLAFALCGTTVLSAQPLFLNDFDDDSEFVYVGQGLQGGQFYDYSISGSELTITGNGNDAAYNAGVINFPDNDMDGNPDPIDLSGSPKLFVRLKSSNGGQFAFQLEAGVSPDPVRQSSFQQISTSTSFETKEITFTAVNQNNPPADLTKVTKLYFYLNPGVTNTPASTTVTIDYIAFGSDKESTGGGGGGGGGGNTGGGPAVYTDALNDDGGFGFVQGSYSKTGGNGEVNIAVNSNAQFENFGYGFRNGDGEAQNVDFTAGDNKLYFRAKATVPVGLRVDLNDVDGRQTNVNTDPRNVRLTTSYEDYVIDFTNELQYWAYGTPASTPCSPGRDFNQSPCPVNASAVKDLFFYANPGASGYSGTITFDYISVGAAPNTTLPVSLASFDAAPVAEGIALDWVTASERDNAFFAVEVSRDGSAFAEVATVEGAGTTQVATAYDYTHYTREAGTYYFRLAQYDFDGTVDRSQVVTATVGADDGGFAVIGTYANQELRLDAKVDAEVTILDLRGAILARAVIGAGYNAVDIAHLPAGHYVVTDGQHAVRFVR